MRILSIAIFSALVVTATEAGTIAPPIDLNQPGALERLKTERPAHFRAIEEVLRAVERVPCGNEWATERATRSALWPLAAQLDR